MKSIMRNINQCPSCEASNRFERFELIIDNVKYVGIRCSKCNQVVFSQIDGTEQQIEKLKNDFNHLLGSIPNNS